MQHRLLTDGATFTAPRHYTGTARRPVQAIAKPSGWRVTVALAAATFAAVFAVALIVL